MELGYYSAYRSIWHEPFYKNLKLIHFWRHLLSKVRHTPGKTPVDFQLIHLERGQTIYGRMKWKEQTGLSERELRTCIKYFTQTDKRLTVHTTNKYSILTLIYPELYIPFKDQDDQQEVQPRTSERPTGDQLTTTNNKNIRYIRENKIINNKPKNLKKENQIKKTEEFFESFWKTTLFPRRPQDDKASMKKKYIALVLKEKMIPENILISSNQFAEVHRGNEYAIGMRKFLQKETVEQYLKGDFRKGQSVEATNEQTMNELLGKPNEKEIIV